MGSASIYGRRGTLSAMFGIVFGEAANGNGTVGANSQGRVRGIKAQGSQSGSTVGKEVAPVCHVLLSQLLGDLELSHLMPCYRAYHLNKQRGCPSYDIPVGKCWEKNMLGPGKEKHITKKHCFIFA